MSTYLITGSSRSLGLGYTRELLKAGHRVIAAVRNPSTGAEQLSPLSKEFGDSKLYLLKCDVTDSKSTQVSFLSLQFFFDSMLNRSSLAQEAAETLEKSGFISESGLDCVIANAGVLGGGWKSSSQLLVFTLHYPLLSLYPSLFVDFSLLLQIYTVPKKISLTT